MTNSNLEKDIQIKIKPEQYQNTQIKGSLIPNPEFDIGDKVYVLLDKTIKEDFISVVRATFEYFYVVGDVKITVCYVYGLEKGIGQYNTYHLYKTEKEAEEELERHNQSLLKFSEDELNRTLRTFMYKCQKLDKDPIELLKNFNTEI